MYNSIRTLFRPGTRSLAALGVAAVVCNATAMAHPIRTREHAISIAASCERLLPLFTAQGERQWAAGWEPEMLSGTAEEGTAFITRAHGSLTTWIVTDFDAAAGRIRYARLAEGSNIGLVEVRCLAAGQAASEVRVRYTLTPVSIDGERFVERFLEPAHYRAFIEGWKEPIESALRETAHP